MNIQHTGGVQGPQPIQPNRPVTPKTQVEAAARTQRTDRAEISEQARLLGKLRDVPPLRQEKIDAIRQQIDDGTYETEDKLQVAIERLLEDLQ